MHEKVENWLLTSYFLSAVSDDTDFDGLIPFFVKYILS